MRHCCNGKRKLYTISKIQEAPFLRIINPLNQNSNVSRAQLDCLCPHFTISHAISFVIQKLTRFELSTICALLLLSTISLCLQLGAISGCDYVRIHFKSLNDNGIYFNNDPYVGLGFFHHQTFVNKDTRDWDFDSTCHKYTRSRL